MILVFEGHFLRALYRAPLVSPQYLAIQKLVIVISKTSTAKGIERYVEETIKNSPLNLVQKQNMDEAPPTEGGKSDSQVRAVLINLLGG